MNNDAPNAAEKRWRERVRAMGSALSYRGPCEVHHCAGRTAMHNKVDIGHWFIVALTPDEHLDVPSWGRHRKTIEKRLFKETVRRYRRLHGEDGLPPAEVLAAIEDYRR